MLFAVFFSAIPLEVAACWLVLLEAICVSSSVRRLERSRVVEGDRDEGSVV